jgi:hypothetical protein
MLKQASWTLGRSAERVRLHEGYIDDAPEARSMLPRACSLCHFLDYDERPAHRA